MKRSFYKLPTRFIPILLLGIGMVFLTCCDSPAHTKSELELVVFKVGKADAMLLTCGNETLLIDTGEEDDGEEILDFMSLSGIDVLDHVLITHYDKDHIGGAPEVFGGVAVTRVFEPGYKKESSAYRKFEQSLDMHGIPREVVREVTSFSLGEATVTLYPPKPEGYPGDNDNSILALITHGKNRFFFAADAEGALLHDFMENYPDTFPADVLKVPHHGKLSEESLDFFSMVNPSLALITDSDKNPADDQVLAGLAGLDAAVYQTRYGNIYVTSDGTAISVAQGDPNLLEKIA